MGRLQCPRIIAPRLQQQPTLCIHSTLYLDSPQLPREKTEQIWFGAWPNYKILLNLPLELGPNHPLTTLRLSLFSCSRPSFLSSPFLTLPY